MLYDRLRDWRLSKAREEGVPPYIILTNRELREIVCRRPDSPTALSNLRGLGSGKVSKHGAEILEILAVEPGAAAKAGVTV